MVREEEKKPYKLFHAGGRSFPVYLEHDDSTGEDYMAYPDFEEFPEYTGDGRPFAMSAQESCPYAKPRIPGDPPPGDCGGCGWFYREQTPLDPIGICMCGARLHGTGYSGGQR
ncbi:MAG: hypothetical protein GX819_01225 [Clostridiaceae bacterium]|nr:hypothetical protein [Clostridiaceae bacterium]